MGYSCFAGVFGLWFSGLLVFGLWFIACVCVLVVFDIWCLILLVGLI